MKLQILAIFAILLILAAFVVFIFTEPKPFVQNRNTKEVHNRQCRAFKMMRWYNKKPISKKKRDEIIAADHNHKCGVCMSKEL